LYSFAISVSIQDRNPDPDWQMLEWLFVVRYFRAFNLSCLLLDDAIRIKLLFSDRLMASDERRLKVTVSSQIVLLCNLLIQS